MSTDQPPEANDTSMETFDETTLRRMKETVKEVIDDTPEVRACICIFDYVKGINNTQVANAFWITRNGAPSMPDELTNGLSQTVRMLDQMFIHAAQATQGIIEDVEEATKTVMAATQQHDEILCQIAEAKVELAKIQKEVSDAEEQKKPEASTEAKRPAADAGR